jgi:ABC-type antimicrobial peptide transport system permease subunit
VAPGTGPVPAIATRAYLAANDVRVGQSLAVTLGDVSVPVKIVAEVAAFPTVSGPGGGLIVSLSTVQDLLTSQAAGIVPVLQWWLRTTAAAPLRMPAGSAVASRRKRAAGLLGNPMSAVPQQALLAVAVAAVIIAAVGFSVGVTASVRERRAQSALLAALGVSRSAQAALLCLEELMLSLPAAAAGLLLGALVARLLILSVTLTATATVPVPPVLIEFPWLLAGVLALAVAAVPVIAAALTVARRPDPAAQLRTAEAA